MYRILTNQKRWLLPTVLILFILEIFTLPIVLELTYADRSETPKHFLTYTPGELQWDDATGVDENGVAVLSLFDARYGETVLAENGDRVVAPGTDGLGIVRLHNSAERTVGYTAVLYQIRDNPELPVEAALSGEGFADTDTYTLPDRAKDAEVLRAVTGKIGGGEIQDFDVSWLWNYYEDDLQDRIDTLLGNRAAYEEANDVTVGLYIVIEDDNQYIVPDSPYTGDMGVGMYVALMTVSGLVLVLLFVTRRKEQECGE